MNILKEIGWAGEVARDPKNEVGPKFNVSGFPTMMIVGKGWQGPGGQRRQH